QGPGPSVWYSHFLALGRFAYLTRLAVVLHRRLRYPAGYRCLLNIVECGANAPTRWKKRTDVPLTDHDEHVGRQRKLPKPKTVFVGCDDPLAEKGPKSWQLPK